MSLNTNAFSIKPKQGRRKFLLWLSWTGLSLAFATFYGSDDKFCPTPCVQPTCHVS